MRFAVRCVQGSTLHHAGPGGGMRHENYGLDGVTVPVIDDDMDGETVRVDRRMIGVFELDNDELEMVDQGALRDEEIFSLDSEPKQAMGAEATLDAPPINWGLVMAAATGGAAGAMAAIWLVVG